MGLKSKMLQSRYGLIATIIFVAVIGEVVALLGYYFRVDFTLLVIVIIGFVVLGLYRELSAYKLIRRRRV